MDTNKVLRFNNEQVRAMLKNQKAKLLNAMGLKALSGLDRSGTPPTQLLLLAYAQKLIALENGVDERYADLVVSQVNDLLLSEGIFKAALKSYLLENLIYTSEVKKC